MCRDPYPGTMNSTGRYYDTHPDYSTIDGTVRIRGTGGLIDRGWRRRREAGALRSKPCAELNEQLLYRRPHRKGWTCAQPCRAWVSVPWQALRQHRWLNSVQMNLSMMMMNYSPRNRSRLQRRAQTAMSGRTAGNLLLRVRGINHQFPGMPRQSTSVYRSAVVIMPAHSGRAV